MVREALARTRPSLKIATKIIRTRGDHDLTAGRKGIFTAELERALWKSELMSRCTARRICPAKLRAPLRSQRCCPVARWKICCSGNVRRARRSQQSQREVCGDKGKRAGVTLPRAW